MLALALVQGRQRTLQGHCWLTPLYEQLRLYRDGLKKIRWRTLTVAELPTYDPCLHQGLFRLATQAIDVHVGEPDKRHPTRKPPGQGPGSLAQGQNAGQVARQSVCRHLLAERGKHRSRVVLQADQLRLPAMGLGRLPITPVQCADFPDQLPGHPLVRVLRRALWWLHHWNAQGRLQQAYSSLAGRIVLVDRRHVPAGAAVERTSCSRGARVVLVGPRNRKSDPRYLVSERLQERMDGGQGRQELVDAFERRAVKGAERQGHGCPGVGDDQPQRVGRGHQTLGPRAMETLGRPTDRLARARHRVGDALERRPIVHAACAPQQTPPVRGHLLGIAGIGPTGDHSLQGHPHGDPVRKRPTTALGFGQR